MECWRVKVDGSICEDNRRRRGKIEGSSASARMKIEEVRMVGIGASLTICRITMPPEPDSGAGVVIEDWWIPQAFPEKCRYDLSYFTFRHSHLHVFKHSLEVST